MNAILPIVTFLAGLGIGLAVSWFARATAARAMNDNAENFLRLARENFRAMQAEERGDQEMRKMAVEELVKPVDVKLKELHNALQQMTGTGQNLSTQIVNLQKETARIAGALNNPRERGRSAEILLERLFEHAGLLRDVHYRTQVVQGNIRPDFIIDMEGQLRVVIDAKAPLIEVMEELENPERQKEAAQKLAHQVREHIKSLSSKGYRDIAGSVDFTVLFLPGDGLYALAVDADRDLIEFAAKHNIVLSSPMLLFGLLRMIHTLARERNLNKNAEEIRLLGSELHKRMTKFFEHFANIGKSLQAMNNRYHQAVGSMERMVMPAARRFEDLQSIPSNTALELPPRLEGALADEVELDDKAA